MNEDNENNYLKNYNHPMSMNLIYIINFVFYFKC